MEIRLATSADAPGVAAIYAPIVRDTAISFEYEPPSAAEMASRIESTLVSSHPWLIAADGGDVVGYAYAGPYAARAAYQWSASVSVYVHAEARGRGVGRSLYAELFARLEADGRRMAVAGITLPNDASVGLHAAMGFEPAGVLRRIGFKLGAWHDVGYFQRTLGSDP